MTGTAPPSFGRWIGSLWLYTLLRFALFGALWAILWLLGVGGLLAPVLALVLSAPLSFVLLARPRAAVATQLEQRVAAQRVARANLDRDLDPDNA